MRGRACGSSCRGGAAAPMRARNWLYVAIQFTGRATHTLLAGAVRFAILESGSATEAVELTNQRNSRNTSKKRCTMK